MHLCSFMHNILVDKHNPERLNTALWPSLSKCMNVFECVYSTLNMRKASQLLHMSLGAISYNIKTLEDALGIKMFARKGRNGLVVTDDGQKLYDYAKRIKTLNKQAVCAFDEVEVEQNVIKIVAHPLAMPMYVMPAIAKIDKNKLDYSIDFSITSRDDALEYIISGKADIAVYPLEWSQVSQYQDMIDFVKVAPYRLKIYFNKKSNFNSRDKVNWDIAKNLNLMPISEKAQFVTAYKMLNDRRKEAKIRTSCLDLATLYKGIQNNFWSIAIGSEFEQLFDCSDIYCGTFDPNDIGIITNWFVCSAKKHNNGKEVKNIVEKINQEIILNNMLNKMIQ